MFKPSDDTSRHNDQILALIDKGILQEKSLQKRRTYLGGSRWGEDCDRKLGYEFHGFPADPGKSFSAQTHRIFEAGHDGERRMARWVRAAGFELLTERADGSQFGWKGAFRPDGTNRLGLNIDGVIINGPVVEGLRYPAMWESKTMNDKKFKEIVAKGLKEANPVYYGQVNSYMATLGEVSNALFTVENKNTSEIYCEIVTLDARAAQECIDRAVRVVQTSSPDELSRVTKDKTNFRCRFCNFSETCWKETAAVVEEAQPVAPWLI